MGKGIVIYDRTYGFGPGYGIAEAVWNDKTVTYGTTVTLGGGHRHLLRTQQFAIATKELAAEAKAINAEMEALHKRASALRKKLSAAKPK